MYNLRKLRKYKQLISFLKSEGIFLTYQDFPKKKMEFKKRTWEFEIGELGGVGTEDVNLKEEKEGRNVKWGRL